MALAVSGCGPEHSHLISASLHAPGIVEPPAFHPYLSLHLKKKKKKKRERALQTLSGSPAFNEDLRHSLKVGGR